MIDIMDRVWSRCSSATPGSADPLSRCTRESREVHVAASRLMASDAVDQLAADAIEKCDAVSCISAFSTGEDPLSCSTSSAAEEEPLPTAGVELAEAAVVTGTVAAESSTTEYMQRGRPLRSRGTENAEDILRRIRAAVQKNILRSNSSSPTPKESFIPKLRIAATGLHTQRSVCCARGSASPEMATGEQQGRRMRSSELKLRLPLSLSLSATAKLDTKTGVKSPCSVSSLSTRSSAGGSCSASGATASTFRSLIGSERSSGSTCASPTHLSSTLHASSICPDHLDTHAEQQAVVERSSLSRSPVLRTKRPKGSASAAGLVAASSGTHSLRDQSGAPSRATGRPLRSSAYSVAGSRDIRDRSSSPPDAKRFSWGDCCPDSCMRVISNPRADQATDSRLYKNAAGSSHSIAHVCGAKVQQQEVPRSSPQALQETAAGGTRNSRGPPGGLRGEFIDSRRSPRTCKVGAATAEHKGLTAWSGVNESLSPAASSTLSSTKRLTSNGIVLSAARQQELQRESWARRGLGCSPPSSPLPAKRLGANDEYQEGSVKVVCRCRPRIREDDAIGAVEESVAKGQSMMQHIVKLVPPRSLEVQAYDAGSGGLANETVRGFSVDAAFGETSETVEVFRELSHLARKAANGARSVIMAYGSTGSGKTHTMYGSARCPGLIQRAAAELLNGGKEVAMTIVELHNDSLRDLLLPTSSLGATTQAVRLRGGSAEQMPTIEGARSVHSTSLPSILSALNQALARRHVAMTTCNASSSRSHLIVTFSVGTTGQLTMLDLAGCERVKRSGAEGDVLREAQSINKSLQQLGDVVEALRRGSAHVPFRSSHLARLVAGSLGGGASTGVVVCVAPVAPCREEALGTLCFAERLCLIANRRTKRASHPPH